MNGIYLLLGSNLGDRLSNLKTAVNQLNERGIKILEESSIYETEPWGKRNQDWFLNIVLQIEIALTPEDLLNKCLEVEQSIGRKREEKWGARIIDIDVLYYYDLVMDGKELSLPHLGIPDRKFTLIPLCEISPMEIHPITKQTQAELLANCTDPLDCRLTDFSL